MCFVLCIINVLVRIIIGQVTDSIHSTVQIPVTRHTTAMHTRPMIAIPDQNSDRPHLIHGSLVHANQPPYGILIGSAVL